eukprot:COSAG01_NODE_10526_length_2142_cov_2.203133_2_plen_118_part_00
MYDVRFIGAEPDVEWRDVLPWSPLHPLTVLQLDAPAEEVLPLEQLEHEPALVPPVLERYRPAAHAVQLLELVPPVLERYLPEAHAVQLLELVPPVLERYLPAGHDVQLVEVCELADW